MTGGVSAINLPGARCRPRTARAVLGAGPRLRLVPDIPFLPNADSTPCVKPSSSRPSRSPRCRRPCWRKRPPSRRRSEISSRRSTFRTRRSRCPTACASSSTPIARRRSSRVAIWYHIGSKNEPAGKTGFAHLFEHLMFYGSENADGAFFGRLEEIGATDWNGTTWFDRTNYFETVPTGALDRALFLESDRMGHLLGAVTQAKLDNQRGVVQNEKRHGRQRAVRPGRICRARRAVARGAPVSPLDDRLDGRPRRAPASTT